MCRKFSGFALSHKDWEDELDFLIEDLSNQADVDNSGTYYTAGYDGKEQIFLFSQAQFNDTFTCEDNASKIEFAPSDN